MNYQLCHNRQVRVSELAKRSVLAGVLACALIMGISGRAAPVACGRS